MNQHYVADVRGVKEVVLHGWAAVEPWRDRLQAARLYPYAPQGRALITLSATDLVWRGLRTHELVISLLTSARADESTYDSAYLLHAFNSSRLFALTERAFFKTPYFPGKIEVNSQLPVRFALDLGRDRVVSAAMAAARARSSYAAEEWRGPVYLPARSATARDAAYFFHVILSGDTEVYPFVPEADRFELDPRGAAVFQQLCDSNFTPVEWRVRTAAHHAKSKTFARGDAA